MQLPVLSLSQKKTMMVFCTPLKKKNFFKVTLMQYLHYINLILQLQNTLKAHLKIIYIQLKQFCLCCIINNFQRRPQRISCFTFAFISKYQARVNSFYLKLYSASVFSAKYVATPSFVAFIAGLPLFQPAGQTSPCCS